MDVIVEETRERIERLEASIRILKRVTIGLVICGVSMALLGLKASRPETVEARSIILRDEAGTVRIRIDTGKKGQGIALYDAEGSVRSEFSLAPDGSPILCLYDEQGLGRVLLEKGFGDSWSLEFAGEHGKELARLGVDFRGSPYLYLKDKSGKRIWSALPDAK